MSKFFKKCELGSRQEKRVITMALILTCLLVILDQASKIMVENFLQLGQRIPIIAGCFNLTFVTNKGAAWGIFHGYGWMLLLIAIVVVVATIVFLQWLTEGWTERYYALFIIVGGVIGNSIDRMWRGEVVDFLDFYAVDWHWPAFNVADSAICVGVAIYFVSVFFRPLKDTKTGASPDVDYDQSRQ